MDVIKQNPVIAAILGGLVVVVALVVLLSGGGDSGSGAPASDRPAATGTASNLAAVLPTVQAEFPGTDLDPIECGSLLSTQEEEDALDLPNRPPGERGSFIFSRGETCAMTLSGDERFFVRIEPGHPTDFAPDTRLLDVLGQPVADLGVAARWYGGPNARAGGEAGVLVVAGDSALGILVFRIVLGRPDLEPAEQLEVARTLAVAALPRFPGMKLPEPDPVTVRTEHTAPDPSNQSYVANLLTREAASEWTRGEGLVATLRLFAGEIDASEVLRGSSVEDDSGSGILRLAREYLDGGADDAAATEIERLRSILIPVDPRDPPATAARPGSRSMTISTVQEEPDLTCYSVFKDHGDPCFMWAPVAHELFGDKYILWFPDLGEGEQWAGWVKGPNTIQDAIVESAEQFESMSGEMPNTAVWLTPHPGGSWIEYSQGECELMLAAGAQALRDRSPTYLEQAIASAMARCYMAHNFGQGDGSGLLAWWEDAASWYLSDVIYPDASVELDVLQFPGALAAEELATTLTDRYGTNMAFFEWIDAARGLEGTMAAVATISSAGPEAVSAIDELLHDFEKALTDGVFVDQGGAHEFTPQADAFTLAKNLIIIAEPQPFGVERLHLTAPSGLWACVEYARTGDTRASWRPGSPGSGSGWGEPPSSFQGEVVIIATAVEPGASYEVSVKDVHEKQDCRDEEEEEDNESDSPLQCDFCDPSSFLYQSVEGWLEALAGGSSQDDGDDDDEPGEDQVQTDGGGGSTGSGGAGSGGGAAPAVSVHVESWVGQFCSAYREWDDRIAITDGVDPTTLDFDDRLERANAITRELAEASDDFLDELDGITAPDQYRDYQAIVFDRVEGILFDMEDYVDDPMETLEDLQDASIERQFGLEFLTNSAIAEVEKLSPGDAAVLQQTMDANPDCSAVPR